MRDVSMWTDMTNVDMAHALLPITVSPPSTLRRGRTYERRQAHGRVAVAVMCPLLKSMSHHILRTLRDALRNTVRCPNLNHRVPCGAAPPASQFSPMSYTPDTPFINPLRVTFMRRMGIRVVLRQLPGALP